MKSDTYLDNRFISKFHIPKKYINDLNKLYEKAKSHLNSFGPRLAGRLHSELNMTTVIDKSEAYKYIIKCMVEHIKKEQTFHLLAYKPINLEIISCWMNDMIAGEYNPPHTHHNGTGWSTVLFLKVPEFIDDTKDRHKFKDGKLCFMMSKDAATFFTPKVGDFYIFTADHQHAVMPFKTKNPNDIRRSMSFNFIMKEKEGEYNPPHVY